MVHDANKSHQIPGRVTNMLHNHETYISTWYSDQDGLQSIKEPVYIYVELKLHKAKTTNQYKANVLELLYLFTTAIRAHPKSLVLLMHKCYKILQQAGSGTMFPGCKQGFTVLLDMYLWWNIQDFRFGLQSGARSWTWYLELLLYIMRGLWIISMTQNPKQSFRVGSKFAFAPLSNFS